LDQFVETVLIPEHTRGALRKPNNEFDRIRMAAARAYRRGDRQTASALRRRLCRLPSKDPHDPGYRRLRYARYADDHILGFIGPKAEAEQIKARLARFLHEDLKLELSQDKTLITHARTSAARFLGYEITVQHAEHKLVRGRRSVNGVIALRVPMSVVKAKCAPYLKLGEPEHRPERMHLDDHEIVSIYGAEYRGIIQYYLLAGDVWRLNRLHWVMLTSMLKTLAAKHRSTVTAMARTYRTTVVTPYGRRRCFQVSVQRTGRKPLVAQFGGIPLRRQKKAILIDRLAIPGATRRKGRELISRVRAGRCELCEQKAEMHVHHVRALADLTQPGRPQPAWAQLMAKRRRKTLVVCRPCHDIIHARPPTATPMEQITGEP
jgi:hypothetical protein